MSASRANCGDRRSTGDDPGEQDRERALLAAVRVAVQACRPRSAGGPAENSDAER